MLPALLDDRRRSLQRLALMLCIFAIATLSVIAPSSYTASAHGDPVVSSVASIKIEKLEYPALDLRRDPFIPAAAYRSVARGLIAIEGSGSAVVRAIVTGAEPRALIESNGSVSVVRIGDRIGSVAVAGIDRRGVTLEGGLLLPLVQGQP